MFDPQPATGRDRNQAQARAGGPVDAALPKREGRSMGLRSSAALIALVTGCASSPSYVFRPSAQTARADAPGTLDGHAAAAYPVPAQSPRGEVKLAPLGVVFLVFPDASDTLPVRGLHVRMVVRNGDRGPWSVDTSTQTADLGDAP